MKRLFLFFVVMCMLHFMMGQEHMKFKGVEIDGTLTEMVTKLEARGFVYLEAEEDIALLQGDFAGYSDCQIVVLSMKETGRVNAVGVVFPEVNEWSLIESNYDFLKKMMTEKYGRPVRVVEEFQSGYVANNSLKWLGLISDECTWVSVFETDKGRIDLYMQKMDYNSAAVVLKYYDKVNTDEARASAMDDL